MEVLFSKSRQNLFKLPFEFLLTVETAVDPVLFVCEFKAVGQLLLDGCDAPGIFAFYNICDDIRQRQRPFFDDVVILDVHRQMDRSRKYPE